MFNFNLSKCPDCGVWHDDGVLIQTENSEDTRFVCIECMDKYLEEEPE